jgi:hypothetical protein
MLIEFNDSLPLVFDFPNYKVPEWDQKYDLIWYLDPDFATPKGAKIWVWKIKASDEFEGDKDMGRISPNINKKLDIVFLSYHEENAEVHWRRLLSMQPHAKRVDGVDGILAAHKEAARVATTDMFYVVDADAYVLDSFKFDFIPSIFDRDCTFVFNSQNSVNRLSYGHGGVKIFPREALLSTYTDKPDVTTSVTTKLKVIDQVSNIGVFNTSPFNAWRTGFRECAKLSSGTINDDDYYTAQARLQTWKTTGHGKVYGDDAIQGAKDGEKFGLANQDNPERLKMINDTLWLRKVFNARSK